jgi:uncharacterized protein YkwD
LLPGGTRSRRRRLLAATLLLCAMAARGGSGDATASLLRAHRGVRARVGVPPLKWSAELATKAQRWARTLIESGEFRPEDGLGYGQNLYEGTPGISSPAQVVMWWASEARNYRHRSNSCSARCGHYTQLVWRDTRMVGCGSARKSDREVWVCNYSPPGNIVGERPY